MDKHLHIITHDVPYPADFGGVIDLFYKIKTLYLLGVKIHLHCFVNKRPPSDELDKYCASVNYYPRNKGISFRLPYIVSCRRSMELTQRLAKDNHPVLIEGIHCSYSLYTNQLTNRKVLLRLHNTEFEYYHHLAIHEKNILKKVYFTIESRLLKKYENKLSEKTKIFAVSEHDVKLYKHFFDASDIQYLPVFLPYTGVTSLPGKGTYCLYHGNLSISENEEAAIWLLQNIFTDLEIPFVIAGKNPSQRLEFLAHEHKHTCLVANPTDSELQDMIAKAQINILPSFNNTGVKLKLLNALYNGRHCIVNKAGVEGSGLESLCTITNEITATKNAIIELYDTAFVENKKRQTLLNQLYNNDLNAKKIIDYFWG